MELLEFDMNFNDDIKCLTCGSDEFRLTRTIPMQILLECLKCGRPHLLEGGSVDGEPCIVFWDPSEE